MDYTVTTKDGWVKIDYERSDGLYKLVDAITVRQAEYESMSEEDIVKIIDQRFANFLLSIEQASQVEEVIEGDGNG